MQHLVRSHSTSSLQAFFGSNAAPDAAIQPPMARRVVPAPAPSETQPHTGAMFSTLRRKPVPSLSASKSAPELGSSHDREPRMPGAFDLPSPEKPPVAPLNAAAATPSAEDRPPADRAALRERVLNLPSAPRTSPPKLKENGAIDFSPATTAIKPFSLHIPGARGVRKPSALSSHGKPTMKRKKATTSLRQNPRVTLAGLVSEISDTAEIQEAPRVLTLSFSTPSTAESLQSAIAADLDRAEQLARIARYPKTPSPLSPRCDALADAVLLAGPPDESVETAPRRRKRCQAIPAGALCRAVVHRNIAYTQGMPMRVRIHAMSAAQGLSGVVALLEEDNIPMMEPIGASKSNAALNPALFPRAGDFSTGRDQADGVSYIDEHFARLGFPLHKISRIACLEDFSGRCSPDGVPPPINISAIDEREPCAGEEERAWIAELREAMLACQTLHIDYVREVDRASNSGRQWELRWRLLMEGERRKRRMHRALDGFKEARDAALIAETLFMREESMEVNVDLSELRDEDSMDVDVIEPVAYYAMQA